MQLIGGKDMEEDIDAAHRIKRRIPIGNRQGVEYPKEAEGIQTEFAKQPMDIDLIKEVWGVDEDVSKDVEFSGEGMDSEDAEARKRSILAERRQRN
jgi:hypothetical protein